MRSTGEISGRVTLKGEPLSGITVALVSAPWLGFPDPNPELSKPTDSKGNYRITGISAGQYLVVVTAPGLIVPSGSSRRGLDGKIINISPGEIIERIDFALIPGSVITGRITGADGRPIAGESLILKKLDQQGSAPAVFYASISNQGLTDDQGVYRINGLQAGRYLVSIGIDRGPSLTSYRQYYQRTFYPGVTEESEAKLIELGEGQEVRGIDFSVGDMKRTYQVSGRMIDADSGKPLSQVWILLGIYGPDSQRLAVIRHTRKTPGQRGVFHLEGLLPGRYGLLGASEIDDGYYGEATPFEVIDSDVSGVEVKMRRGGSISGTVVIEGTNDPAVLAKLPRLRLGTKITTDAEIPEKPTFYDLDDGGKYHIGGLPPGKVAIRLLTDETERNFSIIRLEREGLPQLREIEIGPGERINNLRVVLGYGTTVLRGQMRVLGAALPEGGSWIISGERVDNAESGFGVETDVRGQFVVSTLLPGEYRLTLFYYNRFHPSALDIRRVGAISQFRQRVTVVEGIENVVTLTMDLTPREKR